MIDYI
jgi:hypothetical protein